MIVRLKSSTGMVDQKDGQESGDEMTKDAILVHSGPEGAGVTYMSMDGETKPFDAARIKTIVDNHNKNLEALAAQYGGADKMPQGAHLALLDSHDKDSSHNILGRLTEPLRYEVRDVPKVGKNVACAVGSIKFLGKENIAKVKDGRVYHLSVGIDEDADTLGEVSAVVEPAAPGAMLLGKGNKPEGVKMPTENQEFKKRLSAHQARKDSLSKLKAMADENTSKLAAAKEQARLLKSEGEVSGRLTRLMSAGKMTPAEAKKIDIKKLAALPKEQIDAALSIAEAREPQVNPGQKGTTDAIDFSNLSKDMEKQQWTRMKAQLKGDLTKLGAKVRMSAEEKEAMEDKDHGDKHEMGKHLSDSAQDQHRAKHMADAAQDEHRAAAEKEHMHKMKHHLSALAKHMEEGKYEDAKKEMAALAAHCEKGHGMKHMAGMDEVKSEDYKGSMEHLEGRMDEMETNMGRMASMVHELVSAEEQEGHDLDAAAAHEGGQPGVKA